MQKLLGQHQISNRHSCEGGNPVKHANPQGFSTCNAIPAYAGTGFAGIFSQSIQPRHVGQKLPTSLLKNARSCPIKHKKSKQKKSKNWLAKQNRDQFVRQARSQGLRARSVFKLEQIDKKYRLIKPGSKIVDLGSAPGSWSQYAASKVVGSNQIVGVDLLSMKEIAKVRFIQGDFIDVAIHRQILDCFKAGKIDLVLSDMAPNITGIGITDQANAAQLQEAILIFCLKALNLRGNLLTKLFAGESVSCLRKNFITYFDQVQMIKPDASRAESKEVYLLARGFNKADNTAPTENIGTFRANTV